MTQLSAFGVLREILAAADPDETVSQETIDAFVKATLAAGWLPDQTDYELKHMALVERLRNEAVALDLCAATPEPRSLDTRRAFARAAGVIRDALTELS